MFRTIYKRRTPEGIEKEFENLRHDYNKELMKLRKKYLGAMASLILDYGQVSQAR